jgi:hypothetical protein
MISSYSVLNSDFNVVYHLLHNKEHTKDFIKFVIDTNLIKSYLYRYTKFIDEDLFFELVKLHRDKHGNKAATGFLCWINYTFKKLMIISENPGKLFEKYYDNFSDKNYICFYSFYSKYWTRDLICKYLQNVLKTNNNNCISNLEAFILLNYQDAMDMEKLVELNPIIYIYIFNKTIKMTKYIIRKEIIEKKEYKKLFNFIPTELMENYEIKLELFKNDCPIKDIVEFGKEVIKNGDIKDEKVFDKLMKIKEIKQILIDSLNK